MRPLITLKAVGAVLAVGILLAYPIRLDSEQQASERQEVASRCDIDRNTQEAGLTPPPPQYEIYEVTAYTADYESTGKHPSDPLYGVTASGTVATEGQTIAAPPTLPFGTKVYIPYFDKVFTVEDRGGAIQGKRLDVYMDDVNNALEFGKKKLKILILE